MKSNILFFFLIITAIFCGCSSTLKLSRTLVLNDKDRTTLGGSNLRKNYVDTSLMLPFEKVWEYSGSAGISLNQPLIADSIIFIGFMNGELHAININTGKKIGRVSTDAPIHGCPVLIKDKIFIPLAHNRYSLKAYDFYEGTLSWKKEIEGIESSLLFQDNVIYAATEKGLLLAVNAMTGKTIWEYQAPKKIRSSIAGDGKRIYFGCDNGYLYAIDKNSGKNIWNFFTNAAVVGTPAIDNGGNIFIGSTDNYFYCVNSDSGLMKWKFNSGSEIYSGSAIDDSCVYFGNLSGNFYTLNKRDGSLIWKFKTGGNINSSPTVTKEHVITASFDKKVYVLDKFSGKIIWDKEFEGRIKTSPVIWGKYLLICSEDYDLTLYKF
jgi:eukaryotic-like serine/threonine-protein kinase